MSWAQFPEMYQETARAIFKLADYQELGPVQYVPMAVALLVMTLCLRKSGDWVDIPNLGYLRALFFAVAGWAGMVACMVAFRIGVPDIYTKMPPIWFNTVAGALGSMFLIIPFLCLLTKSRFQSSFMAWFLSLAICLICLGLTDMAVGAYKGGKFSFDKGRQHNQDTLDVIQGR